MTECNTQPVLFPERFSKPVQAFFSSEQLSSNGGAVLLAARDRQIGLCESIVGCMVDERQEAKVDHELLEQLRQRVMGIAPADTLTRRRSTATRSFRHSIPRSWATFAADVSFPAVAPGLPKSCRSCK